MLKTRVFFALLCSTLAGSAYASTQCGREKDHVGYRKCLEKKALQSRVKLDQAMALLARRIDSRDEELEYRQRTQARLQQSFGLFQRFRESHCEFESSLAAGGNGAGDMRLQCEAELNSRYTKSLQGHLAQDATPR